MARPCSACVSPKRLQIDTELAGEQTTLSALARRIGVSRDALRRHRDQHLSPALAKVAIERYGADSAEQAFDSVTLRVESLLDRLEVLLAIAEDRKSLVGGANIAREIRQSLELVARLRGELNDKPQNVTVNVLSTPEFTGVVTKLIAALGPWPEARIAAAGVIDAEVVP